ncbi:cuticle protein 7 [Procambarus clarkii]|uniref:cuticle protein 7 n=1 Tax=Procambarus clarkii TaxID=6728 RepID=UPI003742E3EB
MLLKAYLVAGVVGVVCAGPLPQPEDTARQYGPPPPQYPAPYKPEEEPAKPYTFEYGVKDGYSGANYGHSENSDGKAVSGSYQVDLPDGRTQIVNYVADHHNGFQAQVEYKGEAQYPEAAPYKPAYPSPAPAYPAPPAYSQQSYRNQESPAYESPAQEYHEEPAPVEYN